MPRTRAQRRATDGLFVLGDDALRNVLTFLTPSVCALGPGAASRALRELTTSRQLQVARKSGSYTLRPPENGVVHALATAFGTREWPTRTPERLYSGPAAPPGIRLRVPTPPLRLKVHRVGVSYNCVGNAESRANFNGTLISRASLASGFPAENPDCVCRAGSFIEYELPFQLRITDFRIAFGNCCARDFGDWVFEAYDGDGRWTVLLDCSERVWSDRNIGEAGPEKIFQIMFFGEKVVSSRFRIRLRGRQCMHVRAFELFGTILPRSNPDPAPPSPEEAAVHTSEVVGW